MIQFGHQAATVQRIALGVTVMTVNTPAEDVMNPQIPHALRQALDHRRKLFGRLRGPPPRFVAVDFTLAEDGFPPQDFGLEAFWRVLCGFRRIAGGIPNDRGQDSDASRTAFR
jgi:hypothetical protein